MENKTLEYDVVLNANDYVFHDFHSFVGKGRVWRKILLVLSYILVFIALLLITLRYWYLFPLTGMIIFYPFILAYMAKYRFKSYKSRKLRENLQYSLSERGLAIKGESFDHSYRWSDFKEVTEGSKSFYFWETDSFALLLPKRYLSEDGMFFVRKVGKVK